MIPRIVPRGTVRSMSRTTDAGRRTGATTSRMTTTVDRRGPAPGAHAVLAASGVGVMRPPGWRRSGRRPESRRGAIPATRRRAVARRYECVTTRAAATSAAIAGRASARATSSAPAIADAPPMSTHDRPMTDARTADRDGLRHCSDDRPGITRRRAGRGFTYRDPDGPPVRDPRDPRRGSGRSRSRPPGPTSGSARAPNGHLQATGRDARGRKQYRYHARYRARRDTAQVRAADRLRRGPAGDPRAGRPRPRPGRACRARRSSPRSSGCSS